MLHLNNYRVTEYATYRHSGWSTSAELRTPDLRFSHLSGSTDKIWVLVVGIIPERDRAAPYISCPPCRGATANGNQAVLLRSTGPYTWVMPVAEHLASNWRFA